MVERGKQGQVGNDATASDILDFEKRAAVLLSEIEGTRRPLFVSVEGGWGAGKTTFLQEVRKAALDSGPKRRVICFSPWNVDEGEDLWAAFASAFEEQMRRQLGWRIDGLGGMRSFGRVEWGWFRHKAIIARLFLSRGWLKVGQFASVTFLVVAIVSAWTFISQRSGVESSLFADWKARDFNALLSAIIASVSAYLTFQTVRRKAMHEQAPAAMKARCEVLDLVAPLCPSSAPITLVLIDDLDRCNSETTARMIDTVSTFFEQVDGRDRDLNVAFLIAMDREKVASSLALHYESTAKYLETSSAGVDVAQARRGLRTAHEYLEKLINVGVRVPSVTQPQLAQVLVQHAIGGEQMKNDRYRRVVRDEAYHAAELLRYNPRNLKRFAREALLTLRTLDALGWGREGDRTHAARVVAVLMALPELTDDLRRDRSLWGRLVRWAAAPEERASYLVELRQAGKEHKDLASVGLPSDWPDDVGRATHRDLVWLEHLSRDWQFRSLLSSGGSIAIDRLARFDIDLLLGFPGDGDAGQTNSDASSTSRGLEEPTPAAEPPMAPEREIQPGHASPPPAAASGEREIDVGASVSADDVDEGERPAARDLRRAEAREREVLASAPNSEAAVRAMVDTVHELRISGLFMEAEAKAGKAVDLARRVVGEAHPVFAGALSALGSALAELKRLTESLDHLERALAIHRDSLGDDDPSVATDLSNIGFVLRDLGRLDESLGHHERALAIRRESVGDDAASVATDLNNIGVVLQALGRLDESLDHHERALAIHRESLGDDHPLVATYLNNIGMVLRDFDWLDESLDHLERALAIHRESFGDDHPSVVMDLNNIGLVLRDLGRLDESLDHHERALAIHRESLGGRHPYTAFVRLELARTRHAMGERDGVLDEIEDAYRDLLRAGAPVGGLAVRAARTLFRLGGDPLAICRDELGDEVAEEVRDAMNGPWFGRYDNPAGPIEGL